MVIWFDLGGLFGIEESFNIAVESDCEGSLTERYIPSVVKIALVVLIVGVKADDVLGFLNVALHYRFLDAV